MRKALTAIFNFILKTLAVLCATLAVLATILVLMLLNIRHTLFDAVTYKRAFVENNVYKKVPALVEEQLGTVKELLADPCAQYPLACALTDASPEAQICVTDALGLDALDEIWEGQRNPTEAETQLAQACLTQFADASQPKPGAGLPDENTPAAASTEVQPPNRLALGGEQMAYLSTFTPRQWQVLIAHLLPPDDLQQMTEAALDELIAYYNGEATTAAVPLKPLKARLTGQAGQDLIMLLLNAQPPCTEEQRAQINTRDYGEPGSSLIMCAASGQTLDLLTKSMQRQLSEIAARIPNESTLIGPRSPLDPSSATNPLGRDPQASLQRIHTWLNLSPLLPLAFLLLVALFAVRSRKGWLRWWGIPILSAGVIALGIGIGALPLLEWGWVRYALPKVPPACSASSLVPLSHNVAQTLMRNLANGIMLTFALVAFLGLGMIIGSSYKAKVAPSLAAPGTPGGLVVSPHRPKKKGNSW